MRNIKLTIAYDGTNYYGFQKQRDKPTVAGRLEDAIFKVTKEETKIIGASRLDCGAHSLGQVASFKTKSKLLANNLKNALNSFLPPDIIIKDVEDVDETFNPRHAKQRRYRYIVLNNSYKSPIFLRYSYFFPKFLNIEMMREVGQIFIGKKDFSSFVRGDGRSPIREIKSISITQNEGYFGENLIFFDITGVSFLHNMIRCIVAVILKVGEKHLSLKDARDILFAKDRKLAPWITPPQGLFLMGVDY